MSEDKYGPEQRAAVMEFQRWRYSDWNADMVDQLMGSGGKLAVKPYRSDPITTRHVGTIAFQGTDAQINEAMQKWLGVRANAGEQSGRHGCVLSETPSGERK